MTKQIEKVLKIPVVRKWYRCPNQECGQKLLIYDNTAQCSGVYIRCKKCGERGRNQNKKLEEDICEPVSRVNQERMITWQKKRQTKR